MKKQIGIPFLILTIILSGCSQPAWESEIIENSGRSVLSQQIAETSEVFSEGPEKSHSELEASASATVSEPGSEISRYEERMARNTGNGRVVGIMETEKGTIKEVQPFAPPTPCTLTPDAIREVLRVDETTALPDQIPVYHNPYPSDHEGFLYHVTEENTVRMEQNIRLFLDTLLTKGGYDPAGVQKETEFSTRYVYDKENFQVTGWERSLSISTNEYGICEDILQADFLENELVMASLEHVGIEQPEIWAEHSYSLQDEGAIESHEYAVVDRPEDLFGRMIAYKFKNIRLSLYPEEDPGKMRARIGLNHMDLQEAKNGTVVSYPEALAYLEQKYAGQTVTDIQGEAYYEKSVDVRYFIPCYLFYVTSDHPESDGKSSCDSVYIQMVYD